MNHFQVGQSQLFQHVTKSKLSCTTCLPTGKGKKTRANFYRFVTVASKIKLHSHTKLTYMYSDPAYIRKDKKKNILFTACVPCHKDLPPHPPVICLFAVF